MDCWHRELERAGSEADVVHSASDFLALWSPRELAPVTLGWRDIHIESAADVERMKRWLLETPQVGPLHELGDYFWHATARIGEIRNGIR